MEWSLDDALRLCNELQRMRSFEHLTLTGGDPQAWTHIDKFLELFYYPFKLQFTTALMKDPADFELFREKVYDVRVSFDGIRPETYHDARGVDTDPQEILDRIVRIAHPRTTTMTAVSDDNIDEIPEIIYALQQIPLRKIMFCPIMGFDHPQSYWDKYADLVDAFGDCTSFGETIVFDALDTEVQCWESRIAFHIKTNGDVYPCNLVGGEAIPTSPEFALGNVYETALVDIYPAEVPRCYVEGSPCLKICQFKQRQLNQAGHLATQTVLSVP